MEKIVWHYYFIEIKEYFPQRPVWQALSLVSLHLFQFFLPQFQEFPL